MPSEATKKQNHMFLSAIILSLLKSPLIHTLVPVQMLVSLQLEILLKDSRPFRKLVKRTTTTIATATSTATAAKHPRVQESSCNLPQFLYHTR